MFKNGGGKLDASGHICNLSMPAARWGAETELAGQLACSTPYTERNKKGRVTKEVEAGNLLQKLFSDPYT